MVQRSSICRKAIICGLNSSCQAHKVRRPERSQIISVGGPYCRSSWTGHAVGVNGPLEACSVPPYTTDIRSELHDILECKQMFQKSGSGASASSVSENSYFRT